MTTPIKAVRATITLGDIELDVFQLPDGSYKMSKSQILETVDIAQKRFTEIANAKTTQSLALSSVEVVRIVTENARIDGISIEGVLRVLYGVVLLQRGNWQKAQALIFASGVEALERRADAAFGVIKTENERNNWFTMRMQQSKIFRRSLTDAMKDREDATGEKAPFGYATLRIYRRVGLFDKYQKYKKAKFEDFKSSLTLGELEDLRACEEMIAQFMRKKNMDVMAAIDLYKELFDN